MEPLVYGDVGQIVLKILYIISMREKGDGTVEILKLRRSSGEGNGNPLQDSCLGNPIYRVVWRATVHGIIKDLTGKFRGLRSLAGYSPWGGKESDMTERLHSVTH